MMQTPVIYLVFNRPDLTEQTFAAVRAARPAKLYVVADGPRPNRPGEAEKCAATRAVTERIDWPCEVTRDYSDVNLGCGRRVSSGITNAFKQFEEAIILEDDCLPDPTFFTFCTELLERYRNDDRVMSISGNNFQDGQRRSEASYYFSKYSHCWGWATWQRAWAHYDFAMSAWPAFAHSAEFATVCPNPIERKYWADIFNRTHAGEIDTWDYQWLFACFARGGFNIHPEVNLVSNIGFRDDATHTTTTNKINDTPVASLPVVFHPQDVMPHRDADLYTFNAHYGAKSQSRLSAARSLLSQLFLRFRLAL